MLRERLDAELKTALRERNSVRLSVIRQVKAGVLAQETKAVRTTLDDDGILQVIAKEVKERREAIAEFRRGDREDLVSKAEAEIRELETFLPPPLGLDELTRLVQEAVRESGAQGPKDMGRVMALLMPQTRGRADGKVVSDLVKSRLAP